MAVLTPRRVLLIANPASRRGTRKLDDALAAFRDRGVHCDAHVTQYAGHAAEVATALAGVFPRIDPGKLAGYAQKFAKLFTASIFKWVQSPLAIHVGSLDLDRERALQLPVVQRTEWKANPA